VGQVVESQRLWAEWGGPPLAATLAGNGPEVGDLVRRRAIARLRHLFPDAHVPDDGPPSDYAVAALVPDRIRKEPGGEVVAAENRQYGFERNLLAVRPTGITASALAAGVLIASAVTGGGSDAVYAAVGAAAWTAGWVTYPSERRVWEAAEIYSIAGVKTLAAGTLDGRG
jgi:hypothetical protein